MEQGHSRKAEAVARTCSVKKKDLKNFAKFTGKYLCRSLFFDNVVGLNFAKFLKTSLVAASDENPYVSNPQCLKFY